MLNLTTMSHTLVLVLVYLCTVHALTDEDLEKILNEAEDNEDLNSLRRYPELDELGELKDRLEGLENLSPGEAPVFAPVSPSTDEDGILGEYLQQTNEAARPDNNPLDNVRLSGRRNYATSNLWRSFNPSSGASSNESIIVREYPTRARRGDFLSPDMLTSTHQSNVKLPNTYSPQTISARNSNDNVKNFSGSFIEKLKTCLKNNDCMKRQLAKTMIRRSQGIKVERRNPFCPRRGCRVRGKRLPGRLMNTFADIRKDKVRKRNPWCNRKGCAARSKRHAAVNTDFFASMFPGINQDVDFNDENEPKLIDFLKSLKSATLVNNNGDNNAQMNIPRFYASKLIDENGKIPYPLILNEADSLSQNSEHRKDIDELRRMIFNTCGMSAVCSGRK